MKGKYFYQIDLLKGILIIFVLIMHAVPINLINNYLYLLLISQAVPVFIVILGFNQSLSFTKKRSNRLNYWTYYYKKFVRIFLPFLTAFMASLLLGYLVYINSGSYILRINRSLIFGRLPLPGPGNYFISLLLQYTLTLPFLYRLFRKRPLTALIFSMIFSLLYDLTKNYFSPFIRDYGLIYFKYLPLVFFGMWLYQDWRLFSKKNIAIYAGLLIGFIFKWPLFDFVYAVFLFYFSLKFLPTRLNNGYQKILSLVGKSSYHIFLFQIIYFSIKKSSYQTINVLVNILVCVIIGILFFLVLGKSYVKKNL